jgi:acyl-coenzyme A synthetase/AMP-(fatty) acid ligase
LKHPYVADCAVIPILDHFAGELPKAFVVKSSTIEADKTDEALKQAILKHVEKEKAKYKWLGGGVEFIDVIPKSPSGKILRRLLRDQERKKARALGAKM